MRNPDIQSLPARYIELGSLKILRALPRRQRRMVGAWCFLDRFGPLQFSSEKAMDVAPHPHMGLQTVSWLVEGEIVHHDSLGCEALMYAGQLNLMTSGAGISHSEETPSSNSGALNGVQLWIALPREQRQIQPAFDHYASLPVVEFGAGTATLIAGTLLGHTSPARTFSPIIGAELEILERHLLVLPLDRTFEHALFVLQGDVLLENRAIEGGTLHYLPPGRDELHISGRAGSRILLIGGEPFGEEIVMWWNFVAGTRDEIAQAREAWIRHERFGDVKAYGGPRVEAPALANFAPAHPQPIMIAPRL
jgi:redox-sensitive bicupin YhaK (pirin superfamily)